MHSISSLSRSPMRSSLSFVFFVYLIYRIPPLSRNGHISHLSIALLRYPLSLLSSWSGLHLHSHRCGYISTHPGIRRSVLISLPHCFFKGVFFQHPSKSSIIDIEFCLNYSSLLFIELIFLSDLISDSLLHIFLGLYLQLASVKFKQ